MINQSGLAFEQREELKRVDQEIKISGSYMTSVLCDPEQEEQFRQLWILGYLEAEDGPGFLDDTKQFNSVRLSEKGRQAL